MDDLSDGHIENIFNNLWRECFSSRRSRQILVKYFKKKIRDLSSAGYVTKETGCRITVASIVRYHRKTLEKNGFVCLLGKYHNVLYIAVKLCFDFRLNDAVVGQLLNEIFRCEKTFERILAGAIYGVTGSHFIVGWKSDFRDKEESISAVGYFLQEASARKLLFRVETDAGVEMRKFADVPISPRNQAPLVTALQMLNSEIILLLLRFDACISLRFADIYPRGKERMERELECVRLLLRATPSISKIDKRDSRYEEVSCVDLHSPLGSALPPLKHLCRCEIRNVLRMNSALPVGIAELGLPKSLSDYVDLLLE